MRPVIGLTTASYAATNSTPVQRFGTAALYCRGVAAAGGAPVLIPSLDDPEVLRTVFPLLDGLLLTGGVDIHPARYGREIEPGCGKIDETRDAVEIELLRLVGETRLPTFGICRGNQMMNVAFGGTLIQDILTARATPLDHRGSEPEPARPVHDVQVVSGTLLEQILGSSVVPANSMHHQAVDFIAPGFRVNCWAEDGTVEGIESEDFPFMIAVQCHPEHLFSNDNRWLQLFRAFVQAASRTAARV